MNTNPFMISFGKEPKQLINRDFEANQIYFDLCNQISFSQTYIITGVRGSGKTILMNSIAKRFSDNNDWIVVDINPDRDILEQIASSIYENENVKSLFLKKTFSFSFHGLSFSIEGDIPVTNIRTILEKMLNIIKSKNKKVLLTIDEVTNNTNLRAFFHDYQYLLRQEYPLYLIMTGLPENVLSIQNSKSLTFLYRTPKIILSELNANSIKDSYKNVFNISDEIATNLANLTRGYAFAYQVVGYLFYVNRNIEKILSDFDQYLKIYVYDKIWSSLPENEKKILRLIGRNESLPTCEILSKVDCSTKEFSVYRERLIQRGLVNGSIRGYLSFSLPRFGEFVETQI